jgi:hypothetical protein
METLDTALKMVTKNAFMASLDFTDAYYTLPIHDSHQKLLKFRFQGKLFHFLVVPMGLSSACRYFTKVLKVPLSVLRETFGVAITGYIDNTFLVDPSHTRCGQNIATAADLFQNLGFMINFKKSVLQPTQSIEYLGFTIDSRLMTVTATYEKVAKLQANIKHFLKQDVVTIRYTAQIVGGIMATHPGNPWAPLFTKQLEIEKIQALQNNVFNFDANMTISTMVRQDLNWCLDNLHLVHADIQQSYPETVIQTDASNQGWGFYVPQDGTKAGARWSPTVTHLHINALELLAIELTLHSYCSDMSRVHIRIMSDNTTAIAAVNKQGSTQALSCNKIAKRLWTWALHREIWLSAAHIPGVENVEADHASRHFKDELEWTLSSTLYQHIVLTFGQPDMDLFASHLNCKTKLFCSFQPDPLAHTVDAFNLNWHGFLGYAFPPFCLLPRIMQKIVQDQALVIVVAPYWPTKSWFTMFRKMITSEVFRFPVEHDSLFLPHRIKDASRKPDHHPMMGKLSMMVGLLSGAHYA